MVFSSFVAANANDSADVFQLVRDSTNIGVSTDGAVANQTSVYGSGAAAPIIYAASIMFLDSPSTTSATTYKVQTYAIDSGTIIVNRTMNDTDGSTYFRTSSSITAMEIAA